MLTGIPQEQDMPAPVTTTIFFPLAMDSEISDSVRLVCESIDISLRLRVTVIFATVMGLIKDSRYICTRPNPISTAS
jgi:cell shape-determining protein MreD